MNPYSILVVDDEAPSRTIVRMALEGEQLELEEAANGEDAWLRMLASPPDLVVSDYSMPGLNGVELVERMRQEPSLRDVSVLIVTGHNTLEVTLAAVEAGADDFVAKPFDPDALRVRVLALLRRRERNRRRTPLPSGNAIPEELTRRIDAGSPYAVFFVTLRDFDPYAYKFGASWAESALHRFATLLADTFQEEGQEHAFVGHAMREHFVAVTTPERAEATWNLLLERYDASLTSLFDAKDLERHCVLAADRFGMPHKFSLLDPTAVLVEGPRKDVERTSDLTRLAQQALASADPPGRDLVRP